MADDNEQTRADGVVDTAPIYGEGKKGEHDRETLPSDEPGRVAEGEVKVVKICKSCMVSQQGKGNFCVKCGEELVPIRSVKESCIGELINGKYKIVDQIGSGGMGEVYLGVNENLGQRVAVKFLSHKFTADERVILRFLNEARSYCRVNHPNAVTLLEYGQHDNGSLYLITEFIEGQSLTDTIKEIGPMSLEQIVSVGVQCCHVLSAAHSQGVIHRDLKPDNIMLIKGARGRYAVKVLDFGIAKIIDDEGGQAPMTETGSIFGTPEFMSPEQARGETADTRADLYAMGVILFFLATGKLPFRGKNKFAVLNKHLNEKPPRPSKVREDLDISLVLEAVILKCLNKRPEERYAVADDLAEALEECLVPSGSKTMPSTKGFVRSTTGPIGALGHDDFDDAQGVGVSMTMSDPAVDVHGPTLAEDISESSWSGVDLQSVDISGEGRVGGLGPRGGERSNRAEFSQGGNPLKLRGLAAAAILVLIGVVSIWYVSQSAVEDSSSEGSSVAVEEEEIATALLTAKVTGLLQGVEQSITEGELDGARASLGSVQNLMKEGAVAAEAVDKFQALSVRQQSAENIQRQIRAGIAAGRCDEATQQLSSLQEASSGSAARITGEVERCRQSWRERREVARQGGARAPVQPVEAPKLAPAKPEPAISEPVKPEPVKPEPATSELVKPVIVEEPVPALVDPPKPEPVVIEEPVAASPKPASEPVDPLESSREEEPAEDDEVPDGMALPPRQL